MNSLYNSITSFGGENTNSKIIKKHKQKKPKDFTTNSFEKRIFIYHTLQQKHPDSVYVILLPSNNKPIEGIRQKYIIQKDHPMQTLIQNVRSRAILNSHEALYFFLMKNDESGVMATPSILMSTLYEQFKSKDGFLYIQYSAENTFG